MKRLICPSILALKFEKHRNSIHKYVYNIYGVRLRLHIIIDGISVSTINEKLLRVYEACNLFITGRNPGVDVMLMFY